MTFIANEVRVSAELPGMDEKLVEVLVENEVLTICGEKKSESEDQGRRFSERYCGLSSAASRAALGSSAAQQLLREPSLTALAPTGRHCLTPALPTFGM